MTATVPRVYILATLQVRRGKTEEFCKAMASVVSIMEKNGWRLEGAWGHLIGRLNTVIDLWSMPDANAVPNGFVAMMQSLEFPKLAQALADTVEDEVLQLMTRMPYDPGRI